MLVWNTGPYSVAIYVKKVKAISTDEIVWKSLIKSFSLKSSWKDLRMVVWKCKSYFPVLWPSPHRQKHRFIHITAARQIVIARLVFQTSTILAMSFLPQSLLEQCSIKTLQNNHRKRNLSLKTTYIQKQNGADGRGERTWSRKREKRVTDIEINPGTYEMAS